jgi:folate-binding Fe-S cluster repair protein YgfZ
MTYSSPLLARPGAVAATGPDEGVAWHYGDPVAEQRALARGGAVVDQSHLGVVRVAGPDRLSWLHSITSQDVEHLRPRESTELFVLSPQGHVEHAAGVVDDGEATWLITERASAPGLAAWLGRMKVMMRVEIEDLTGEYVIQAHTEQHQAQQETDDQADHESDRHVTSETGEQDGAAPHDGGRPRNGHDLHRHDHPLLVMTNRTDASGNKGSRLRAGLLRCVDFKPSIVDTD